MNDFIDAYIDFCEEVWYWVKIPFVLLFFVVLTLTLPFIMKKPEETVTE